jgi:hypothetical protein
MAQSNHHRPGIPAGDDERLAYRTSSSARQSHPDPSASARHTVGTTRLPVCATDEPCAVEPRVCVGQARP